MSHSDRRDQIVVTARQVFGELGYAGTRLVDIAERAGITRPALYRHFDSKDALYREAFLDPLDNFVDNLTQETHQLAARSDMGRLQLVQHFHELFLGHLKPVGPLLAASRFARAEGQPSFLQGVVIPRVRTLLEELFGELTGLSGNSLDMDVVTRALIGVYFGLVAEGLLQDKTVDTATEARQLNLMFATGLIPGSTNRRPYPSLPEGYGTFWFGWTPPAITRLKLPRAERRQLVQAAAREVFYKSGINGATGKEIAERAGITEAFLYRLFDSKEEIYAHAVEAPVIRAFEEFTTQVRMLANDRAGREFLHSVNELGIRFFTMHSPVIATALYSDLTLGKRLYIRLRPIIDDLRDVLVDRLDLHPDLDPELVRRAVMGTHMALGFDRHLIGRPHEIRRAATQLTTVLTGGYQPRS
jgi:AcrR family transcriptional regulator